ncbi:hypothetical protein [Ideonella sp.]|uniref:hypothetical protein n=1 Tax=Ideonella sp. TaxID=1929293 RepID=UPI0035B3BCE8
MTAGLASWANAVAEGAHAGQGFLRVSLPWASDNNFILVRRLSDRKEFKLTRQPALGPGNFGQWVPPGEYEVPVVSDGQPFPPVVAQAGRMTDLGGMIDIDIGGYEVMTVPFGHTEFAEEARIAAERLAPELSDSEALAWRPGVPPKPRKVERADLNLGLIVDMIVEHDRRVNKPPVSEQIKKASSPDEVIRLAMSFQWPEFDEPAIDRRLNAYYGAGLGQIRARDSDGRWSNLDTGVLQRITSVEADGDRLVAGTANGSILVSPDGGQHWSKAMAFSSGEMVIDIDRVGSHWIIMTAPVVRLSGPIVDATDQFTVYATSEDDLSKLEPVKKVSLPDKLMFIEGVAGVHGDAMGDSYFVNGVKALHRLDLKLMQWTQIAMPFEATNFHVVGDVITIYRQRGMFSKLSVSTDGGATWLSRDTPPSVFGDVVFHAPDKGTSTRLERGAFSVVTEFMTYDAKSNKWTLTHASPNACLRLIRDAEGAQRYCVIRGGSILNFVDGKWVVEFAVN